MKSINWTQAFATTAFYSASGAVAGFIATGSEHAETAAVEGTFITSSHRWAGAQRGALAGGLFGVGLLGSFAAFRGKGQARMLGAAAALIGIGGLAWTLKGIVQERTSAVANTPRVQADAALPPQDVTGMLSPDTERVLQEAGINQGGVPSDAELLTATQGSLGRAYARANRYY